MTQVRMDEILQKIAQVASGEETEAGRQEANYGVRPDETQADVSMHWAPDSPDIIIDMLVYKITEDENDPERMNVSYSSSKSTITGATQEQKEQARVHFANILNNTAGSSVPKAIKDRVVEQGEKQIDTLLEGAATVEEV